MDTINTTTLPLITNNFGGFLDFDLINIRLESTEPHFFSGFKIDDDIVLFLMSKFFQVVVIL